MKLTKKQIKTWPSCPLDRIALIQKGKKPSKFCADIDESLSYLEAATLRRQRIPQYVLATESSDLVYAEQTDTIILWDGANAGEIFPGMEGVVASTMARVRVVSGKILPEFLYFFVSSQSPYLRETTAGSTVPHVRGNIVQSLSVPLPPLSVQERIVQILQKVSEIRRKHQEATEIADAILSDSFIGMFGDPSKNHDKFERVPLGRLAEIRSGVTKGKKLGEKKTVEVQYIRVANVQDGFLDLSEVKTIEVLVEDVNKFHLEDGDILMTEGGDPDKLGRGCVWRNQVKNCIHQNHVFRVRTNRDKLAPEYLAALLRSQYAKHYFLSCAKRSSNLASVNSTQVRAFSVPLPPIKHQEEYVSLVEQWVRVSEKLTRGLKDVDKLWASIMGKAFTGELTAEWEAANAEWITSQINLQERLPQLLILALIREQAARAGRKVTQTAILVTALMKYVFLLQMEGKSNPQFYHFIPYHYGPFAKELYADLEKLQAQDLVHVLGLKRTVAVPGLADRQMPYGLLSGDETESNRIEISLTDKKRADETLDVLPNDLKEDVATILDTYGDLDHNALLKTVYEKYPAYAQKSRLRRLGKTGKKGELQ